MSLLYEPREKDERVFIGRDVIRTGGGLALGVVDAEDHCLNQHALRITVDGLRRYGGTLVARLNCAHDADGCIALHPDDPAMRKIAELEARVRDLEAETVRLREAFDVASSDAARVKELDEKHEEALRREKAANDALHLEQSRVALMAELNAEIERGSQTPTVAPELTDEQYEKLCRAFNSPAAGPYASFRAMLAAYEAMRRPITDEDVERAANAAAHASTFTWTSWDVASDGVKNDYRRIARAVLETVR